MIWDGRRQAGSPSRAAPLAFRLPRWDALRMTPEEFNRTAEEIGSTPEAIVEAIRAGDLVEAIRANANTFNLRPGSGEAFHPEELVAFHPEVEWTTRTDLPDSRTYRGREGVATLIAEWIGAFDNFLIEPLEIFETSGKVVAVLRLSGHIKGSDQQVAMEEVHVLSVRDGMFSEVSEYPTKREALTALGLSESMTFANRFVKSS